MRAGLDHAFQFHFQDPQLTNPILNRFEMGFGDRIDLTAILIRVG